MSETHSFAIDCRCCGGCQIITMPLAGFVAWRLDGELIQQALPELTADEREILISGICGKCFDGMFADRD